MNMNALALRYFVSASLLAASICAWAENTIKIAFIGAMTGPYALVSEERYKVFLAAADIVNSRGGVLGGRKIEVSAFDNKNDPREALIVLEHAIDLGFQYVTTTQSSIAHAINDAVVKHNDRNPAQRILFLDYGALDPALTEERCNFWHFRFQTHGESQVKVLTDFIAKIPTVQKVYLINEDYAFGRVVQRVARQFLEASRADVRIVGDDLIPLGKIKDFAPYIAKIHASGADSVVTSNAANDLSLLVKAGSDMGINVTYYTLFAGLPGSWSSIPATAVNNLVTIDTWNINATDRAWETRLLNSKVKLKARSNLDYMPPYRILEMFAAAVEKAGSTDPFAVGRALEGMRYTGPSGDAWMRTADHQLVEPLFVLRLAKAGDPGVLHDIEGTGFGWKTEKLIAADDLVPPIKCQMVRPTQ